jgi:hypothetical protein
MYSDEPAQVERLGFDSIVKSIADSKPRTDSFGSYLMASKERISSVLFDRNLIGRNELFYEQLLSSKETAEDNYFVCNYFLQKYFDLSWTVYFHKDNVNP